MSTQTTIIGHDEHTGAELRDSIGEGISTFEISFRSVTSSGAYRGSDSCTVHLSGLSPKALKDLADGLQGIVTSLREKIK